LADLTAAPFTNQLKHLGRFLGFPSGQLLQTNSVHAWLVDEGNLGDWLQTLYMPNWAMLLYCSGTFFLMK